MTASAASGSNDVLAPGRNVSTGGKGAPSPRAGGHHALPFVVDHGRGARLWDTQGREYIDFVLGHGALAAGHAAPAVLRAIENALGRGTAFGAPTTLEATLADLITERMPHLDAVRFVAGDTDAAIGALRAARAHTRRDYLLKFDSGSHGDADAFLVRAGSGVSTLGLPSAAGVPALVAALTLTAPYNDLAATRLVVQAHASHLAAILVEPVCVGGGFIVPQPGFLEGLRQLAVDTGAVLIFDEVSTGFRVAPGGARERFGITPDLTILGRVIGGGLPLAAYGGRREIMSHLDAAGPARTGNGTSPSPVAMAGGIATLEALTPAAHAHMADRAGRLVLNLEAMAAQRDIPLAASAVGSMWGATFRRTPARSFADARDSDARLYERFHRAALARGVHLPSSPLEGAFLSTAHGDAELDEALSRLDDALGDALR